MADIDVPLSWRMQQDGYLMQIKQLRDENAKLRNENARLRELVDYMTPIALYAASEQERDHMRELGIEVSS